ncbi:MAG: hypothetical protein ACPGXL_03835 [Chitinophagales bacterium]
MKLNLCTLILGLFFLNTTFTSAQTKLVASRAAIQSPVHVMKVNSTGKMTSYHKNEKSVQDYAMNLTTIMAEQLELTPEQNNRIYDLNIETTTRLEALRGLRTKNQLAYKKRITIIAAYHNAILQDVLTPYQFKRYLGKSKFQS